MTFYVVRRVYNISSMEHNNFTIKLNVLLLSITNIMLLSECNSFDVMFLRYHYIGL